MGKSPLIRTFSDVRVDGRTLVGTAVPYGEWATINDGGGTYQERFVKGAFARSLRERGDRIKLMTLHDQKKLPIGRAVRLVEADDGLQVEAHVSETAAGDEVLTLVRDGALDSLSVSFIPVRDDWDKRKQRVTRREAKLVEISVVPDGAYASAKIAAVRSGQSPRRISVDVANRRLSLLKGTTI